MKATRVCTISDCGKPWKAAGLCSMHLERKRRHGDANISLARRVEFVVQRDGYLRTLAPDHPLAMSSRGYVMAHRKVLYGALGPGSHPCHWCGRELHWMPTSGEEALFTDHLDWVRSNNDLSNLVPSCQACNVKRLKNGNRNLGKTHCPRGHEYAVHAYITTKGHRQCRACRRLMRADGKWL